METADLDVTDRVRAHTAPVVKERIDAKTEARIACAADAGPAAIDRRLAELDTEWDVDRALMATFAVLGGASHLASTLTRSRRARSVWTGVLRTQLAFLLVHAVVGWCPPASVLRRLGFRTQREIEAERRALENLLSPAP